MASTIVVGVDGSAASVAALRWAVDRATAEHHTVTAVEVRTPVRLAPGTSYAPGPYGLIPPERHGNPLHDAVAAVRKAVPNAPTIAELQRRGDAGVELARVAHDAAMLVLGHNPHGKLTELLFGDVTSECLRHARVPVVLVPAPRSGN